ncbi:MAG TPA: hypothetical protein VGE36_16425 [Roseateles sp.]
MSTGTEDATARRRRRTVVFDAALVLRLLDDAARARPGPVAVARAQQLWLLKAFVDAAQPAAGLAVDVRGWPLDLAALQAQAVQLGEQGAAAPRVLRKLRAGQPLDWRLAQALLSFFKVVLDRPALRLDEIGGAETARLQAVAGALREAPQFQGLPAIEALLLKAHESAVAPWVFDAFEREYRQLRRVVDVHGRPRIALERVSRYVPVKTVAYERSIRPSCAYEWHEWARFAAAELVLRQFDARGRCRAEWTLALTRRLDEMRGFVICELAPEQPVEVEHLLLQLARAAPGRQPRCQFEWREQMLLNLADRDIVVSYCPITALRLHIDAGPDFIVQVGDAPGLTREGEREWRLHRALLPREVLAVRLRWAGLTAADALALTAAGELPQGLPALRQA